jgi:hypothetical protein
LIAPTIDESPATLVNAAILEDQERDWRSASGLALPSRSCAVYSTRSLNWLGFDH